MEYLPVDDLVPDPRNPKGHADDDLDASFERFGYADPIVIDERTGRMISGHGRQARIVARHAAGHAPPEGVTVTPDGRWLVPVSRGWRSADDDEALAYLVAANNLTTKGGWRLDPLASILQEIAATPAGLVGTGYESADLDRMLAELAASSPTPGDDAAGPDEDVPPAVPENPVTVRGDVWLLGRHRLMCGDCREPGDVATLLDGATVNVAVTSPPYAEQREYDETSGFRPIPPDGYVAWFEAVQANVAAHLADDGSWLVNIKPSVVDVLDRHLYVLDLVIAHVRSWGWHFGDEFCWERNGVPKAPTLRLKNQFEPVYHFARARWKFRPEHVRHASDAMIVPLGPGAGNTSWNAGDRGDQGSPGRMGGGVWKDGQVKPRKNAATGRMSDAQGTAVDAGAALAEGWAYPGNRLPTFIGSHEAVGHSAAFPVGLPDFLIRLFSDDGDVVLDPFSGSGSTLLAAEQTGRRGFGMELSPGYVDVTLARWQRRTGVLPVRAATGEAVDFAPLAEPAPA